MSRFWLVAPAVLVTSEAEWPLSFCWQEHWHPITVIANHWRIDQEWWQSPIIRDTFLVITSTGLLAVLFHDLTTDSWHLQRVYD